VFTTHSVNDVDIQATSLFKIERSIPQASTDSIILLLKISTSTIVKLSENIYFIGVLIKWLTVNGVKSGWSSGAVY